MLSSFYMPKKKIRKKKEKSKCLSEKLKKKTIVI